MLGARPRVVDLHGGSASLLRTGRETMAIANEARFIVRAEIRTPSDSVISYGFDLTATSFFGAPEWPAAIGTRVALRLSFRKILEPIDVTARISDIRIAGEPGEPGGIRLAFEPESGEVVGKLAS